MRPSRNGSWLLSLARWAPLALPILLSSSSALAEEPRIAIVTNHADAAIIPLLRGELRSLGMDVVEVEKGEHESLPGDLNEAARSLHAVAAVRVLVSSRTVEVWIADRVTGKVVLREIFAADQDSKVQERLVVVQAIELLRASLMELEAPHPARGEMPAPPSLARVRGVPETPTPPSGDASGDRERFSFGVAASVVASPGGAGPGLGAMATLGVRASWFGAGVVAGSTITPAELTRPAGAAEMTTRWLGAEVFVLRPPSASRFRARVGLGLSVVFTGLRGVADLPRLGFDTTLTTAAPMLHGDVGYAFTRNLRVTAGAMIFAPLRWSTIVFDGQEVGTYGRLLVAGTLGLEAAMP